MYVSEVHLIMATGTTSGNAAIDLASLEIDAKAKARVQVANLLQVRELCLFQSQVLKSKIFVHLTIL